MTERSSGAGSGLQRAQSEHRPRWVLDTNVVLDWLIFDDAAMRAPGAWLRDGLAHWIASAAMREEALDVAARAVFSKHGPANALRDRVAQGYARYVQPIASTAPSPLICADPDDQMFIDLALEHKAALLLTRDKALLALAPAALARGLRVARPRDLEIPAWPAA